MTSWLSFNFNITKEKTYSTSFVGCHDIIITFFLKNIKTWWIVFNVMLVFQVIGAFWYFFSIERETVCWHKACENQSGCGRSSFSCAHSGNYTFLDYLCPINAPNSTLFDFGIFLEAHREIETHTWGEDCWVTHVSEVPHWIKMRRMSS